MRSRRGTINTVSFFAFQDIITSVVGIFVLITLIMILELAQSKAGQATAQVAIPQESLERLTAMEQEVARLEEQQKRLQTEAQRTAKRNVLSIEEELSTLTRQLQELEEELNLAGQRTEKLRKQLADAKQNEKQLQAQTKDLNKKQAESKSLANAQQEAAKVGAILEIEKPLIFRDQTEQGRYLVMLILVKRQIEVSDAKTGLTQSFTGTSRLAEFASWLKQLDVSSRQFLLIVKPSGETDIDDVRKTLAGRPAIYGFDLAGEEQKFRLRSQLGGL